MLESGDVIGSYTLVKFVGRGQFGEVWLAEKKIGSAKRVLRYALKFIPKDEEGLNVGKVADEIDAWIEASGHPNVVSVLDMEDHDKFLFIVSEYADGGSLGDILRAAPNSKLAIRDALAIIAGVLKGLDHLHSRNVVHRDLKPDNILLQAGVPKIADFGISRIVTGNATTTIPIGSPIYMSPDAFEGSKSPSDDIWSVGVILYQLLSGQLPFSGENVMKLQSSIIFDEPTPLSDDVPEPLKSIVLRALRKDKKDRYQTIREIIEEIDHISHDLIPARPLSWVAPEVFDVQDIPPTIDVSLSPELVVDPEQSIETVDGGAKKPLIPTEEAIWPNILPWVEPIPDASVETQTSSNDKKQRAVSIASAGGLLLFIFLFAVYLSWKGPMPVPIPNNDHNANIVRVQNSNLPAGRNADTNVQTSPKNTNTNSNVSNLDWLPEMLFKNGLEDFKNARYDSAISNFSSAIALRDKFDQAYYWRGYAKAKQQKYKEAIDDYNQAIFLKQKASYFRGRANAYESLGQHWLAAADRKAALGAAIQD